MQIAIDGPASSGKSTVAKLIAKHLGIIYIDTGAMYRAVTYQALRQSIQANDIENILQMLKGMDMTFKNIDGKQFVFNHEEDISLAIRSDNVTAHVSEFSAIAQVREFLVEFQRQLAFNNDVIMDGRDIGTVVLPQADYKFFLVASSRVRAQRRYEENIRRGISDESIDTIEENIIKRDQYDSQRKHSPLVKAHDAIEIDTSDLSIDEVVDKILNFIQF